MKIGNEIRELLKQSNGEFKINEAFKLVRFTYADDDYLGRTGEFLYLEMLTINNGRKNFFSEEITSRDTPGIMEEVAEKMQLILNRYSEQLIRRWKGGLD